ncbi:MAG: UDP-N-acetylmuramoyl-tripeptide--D-alanyl-D-alanine ligase, partial [Deltaproteobacteria bacterium]|nr:UDP-N-acetylmuramoyl-tripeptide--D-alanyl-D-alanine ligase [Deltaproteobacteria bacterium]
DVRSSKSDERTSWVFEVPDTLHALGDMARWWRMQFDIPCVAITGSNGKTTTKEMTASILQARWKILKTEGNFNNLIGLPLTLNHLNASHQAMVLEMGMNDFGEIRRLTEIAEPTVGAVTNAAAAHLEKLESVEKVAEAKAELYDTMNKNGVAVYNAEDLWLSKKVAAFSGKKISFGMGQASDVRFEHMECSGFDSMELKLSVQGKHLEAKLKTTGIHNVMNAMTACAVACGLGLPLEAMKEGLENFKPLKMRFEQIQLANGVRLVNDAYNANPLSMEAAFRTVGAGKRAGRFIAVLGDMKELGKESARLHEETGKKAVEHGVAKIFVIGKFATSFAKGALEAGLDKGAVTEVQDMEEVAKKLAEEMKAGDVVLVKGSRAMHLETVVEALKEKFGI